MANGSTTSQREVGSSSEPCPLQKASILVTVQDEETNEPVPKVGIELKGPTRGNKQSDPAGEADFKPVNPGNYEIDLTLTGELAETYLEPQDPTESVSAGDEKLVPVTLVRVKSWIEIELVGEDDQPVPGERYQITLPDGEVLEGTLDSRGRARKEGIAKGTCKVTFPGLDKDAWEFVRSTERPV